MKNYKKYLCLALFIGAMNLVFSQTTINGELKKWHTVTLVFDGPTTDENASNNPFLNYRLNVTFTAPNGTTFLVPGFFAADGNASETSAASGNKWAVRFTPNQTGSWSYKASFRTGQNVAISSNASAGSTTSFDGTSGNFNIGTNNKSLPDNRAKGRLNYVGERYLKFKETGTYFLKAGADSPENLLAYNDFDNTVASKSWSPHSGDWNSGDATWKNGKGKELIGAVNYLAEQGMNAFSFLTMNIKGDGKDVWPYTATSNNSLDGDSGNDAQNRLRFDVSKLEQWEVLFSHADKKGMYLHFKTQETENDQLLDGGSLGTQRKLYYRELIARFGHHLAINWNIGEENTQTTQQQKDCINYFKDNDPYDNHIVLHTFPGQQSAIYPNLIGSKSNLTGPSVQTDVSKVHNDIKKWVLDSKNAGKAWVVANDEQGNAQRGVTTDASYSGNKGNQGDNREDVRQDVLWGTFMAGGAGVEYYFGYSTGETDLTAQDFRSRRTKWADARIALDFFKTNLPYWKMETNDGLTSNNSDYCLAEVGETYAIYLPNGGSTSLNLSSVSGSFSVKWFNPRSGGNLLDGNVTTISGGGNRSIGNPPNNANNDWAVVVKKTDDDDNDDGDDTACESGFVETNGLVVIETENLDFPSGWSRKTEADGYTGNGYLEWLGGDNFGSPGNGKITTTIKISTTGTYLFEWRNKVGEGTNTTESNDSWLRFPDADDFYGEKSNGSRVYPKGSGKSPSPNGAGSDGWFKVYTGGTTNWNFSSNTSDNDAHKIYVKFDSPGTYTLEISGRSNHHLIDRMVLSRNVQNARSLSLSETPCDDDTTNVAVTGVSSNPGTSTLNIGETITISTTIAPTNADNKNLTWSSSNTGVASVNANGKVTALKEGSATITATTVEGGFKATTVVTVEQTVNTVPVTSVGTDSNIRTVEFAPFTIKAIVRPSNATNKSVIWESSDTSVATVDQSGLVTPLKAGKVSIIVTTVDGGFVSDADITIKEGNDPVPSEVSVTGVSLNPTGTTLNVGETFAPSTTVSPSNADNKNVTWSSSNTQIATVSTEGVVSALKAGTANITVTTVDGGFEATTVVTVEQTVDTVPVTSVGTDSNIRTVEFGPFTIKALVRPSNATNRSVIWESSDTSVATVDQSGVVTPLKAGEVSIIVTTVDGGFVSDADITIKEGENNTVEVPVTGVYTDSNIRTVDFGEPFTIKAIVSPANATNKIVIWESSDTSVATVDQAGVVTPLKAGEVSIIVTTVDGGYVSDADITIVTSTNDVSKTSDIEAKKLSAYPNPATSGLIVTLDGIEKGDYDVLVLTLAGAVQSSKKATIDETYALQLTNLTPGIYVIAVQNSGKQYLKRIIIR